ncbi:MAG: septum site-determining protein MinC [Kofleriaceae bacterium]
MTALHRDESWGDGAPASSTSPSQGDSRPAALLRGGARGLEAVINARAPIDAIVLALLTRLSEAPGFFRGSDVRIRVDDGPLPAGYLTAIEEIATRFELRIVEVGAARATTAPLAAAIGTRAGALPAGAAVAAGSSPAAAVPQPASATGSSPAPATSTASDHDSIPIVIDSTPTPAPVIEVTAPVVHAVSPPAVPTAAAAQLPDDDCPTRTIVGPIRSGVILEHPGHLIVFGDVNPGAEVRARGNIVVLGRLRGTAHAGIGRDTGFILTLRLEAQQLRICRQVARAGDSDTASEYPEIAHLTGNSIIVERYHGKLPGNLSASI